MVQRVAIPPICPHCLQPATDTIEISSRGTVVGYCDAYSSRFTARFEFHFVTGSSESTDGFH